MMGGIGAFLLRHVSPMAIVVAGIILFYEGIPLGPLRYIPFVGPVLENLTDGRVDRERKAGATAEAAKWEEAMRKLRLALEAERAAAQDKINAIERDYLARRHGDQLAISGLERALAEMEPADAENPSCPARPAIPGGVSRQLDQIGR